MAAAASCSVLKKMEGYPDISAKLTEPIALQEDGTVPVSVEVTIPEEYRGLHTGVLIYPYLQSADSTVVVPLDTVAVDGIFNATFNDRMDVYQAALSDSVNVRYSYAPKGEATVLTISDTLAFEPWMEGCTLELDIWGESYGKREPLGHESFPSDIVVPQPEPEPEPIVYEEVSEDVEVGCLRFRIGSAEADSLDNDTKARIEAALSKENVQGCVAHIVSSCSPEASEEFNRNLAQSRAETASELLKPLGIENVEMEPIGVDWDTLYNWLAENESQELVDKLKEIEDPVERYVTFRDKSYPVWQRARSNVFKSMRSSRIVLKVTSLIQSNK